MTKRENFEALLTILDSETARGEDVSELVNFVVGEITLIDKRKNAPRKPTQAQRENVRIKQDIFDALTDAEAPLRASAIATEVEQSVQKVTALLRQLVADKLVERIENKKVVTFGVKE
jgi:predicted transcriptional regulator